MHILIADILKSPTCIDKIINRYLGRFEVEIGDSKNMGVLELCLDMGSRIKNRFWLQKCPFKSINSGYPVIFGYPKWFL